LLSSPALAARLQSGEMATAWTLAPSACFCGSSVARHSPAPGPARHTTTRPDLLPVSTVWPSADMAMLLSGCPAAAPGAASCASSCPPGRDQTHATPPSSPLTAERPSAEMQQQRTAASPWPMRGTLMQVASLLLAGAAAAPAGGSGLAGAAAGVTRCQAYTCPSLSPVITMRPSSVTSAHLTWLVWPASSSTRLQCRARAASSQQAAQVWAALARARAAAWPSLLSCHACMHACMQAGVQAL
jgi:hypothetical protein